MLPNGSFKMWSAPLASLLSFLTLGLCFFAAGCASEKKEPKQFEAGEKAQIDRVTYDVIDTETFAKLDDGGAGRIPENRFYLTQISVFNAGNSDYMLPTMTLIDDQGKGFPELADGRGVPNWVGITRKLPAGETLRGTIVFDAPVKHYKLRISDEFAEVPVYVNLPLAFVHEKGDLLPPKSPTEVNIFNAPSAPGVPAPSSRGKK